MTQSPKVLLPALGCALLLALALALLAPGSGRPQATGAAHQTTAHPSTPASQGAEPTADPTAGSASPRPASPSPTAVPTTATPTAGAPGTPQAVPSGAPAPADGPAADPAIEAQFQKDHPSDLSPQDAAQVRTVAQQVWLAETTGQGRDHWPAYFPPAQKPLRPYTQVRVQAVSAHTSGEQVIVQLLWAGADPSGTYQDRRPAVLSLARTAGGWEPVR